MEKVWRGRIRAFLGLEIPDVTTAGLLTVSVIWKAIPMLRSSSVKRRVAGEVFHSWGCYLH